MSQTDFGLYRQMFLAIGTMITLLPLGFAMSAYYFLPRNPEGKGRIIFNIVCFHLCVGILSGVVLIVQPGLLAWVFNSPELTDYGRVLGIVVLLWTASSFFEIVAVAHGETYFAALFVVVNQLSRGGLLLAAALWEGSLQALVYAALVHGVLQVSVLWTYLASRFPGFWLDFDWSMMRSQLSYALPLGAAALLWIIQMDLHHYVVSHRFGAGTYAIYAIGCFQFPLLGILRDSVGAVMIARVSELRKQGDIREILLLTARMMRKLALVLFPMYVFFLVTRHEFIAFLFTEKYLASASLFAINLTLIPMAIISNAYDPVFRVCPEHIPFLLKARIVFAALVILGLWFGTEYFGLKGAIGSVVLVSLLERLLVGFKACRVLAASWSDLPLLTDVGKLALSALVAGGVAMFVRQWALDGGPLIVLLSCGAAFGVTYALSVFLLGVLTREEQEAIRRRFTNEASYSENLR